MSDFVDGAIHRIENTIKKGKFKYKRKKLKDSVLKDFHQEVPDIERDKICKDARKKAHTPKADMWRNISNDERNGLL